MKKVEDGVWKVVLSQKFYLFFLTVLSLSSKNILTQKRKLLKASSLARAGHFLQATVVDTCLHAVESPPPAANSFAEAISARSNGDHVSKGTKT